MPWSSVLPPDRHTAVPPSFVSLRQDVVAWCAGRWWHWRALVLAFLAWNGYRALQDPEYGGLFGGITFGVHEFGHLLFAPFGEFMTVAGGSLTQILVPLAAGALILRSGDYFGLVGAGAWLSSSLANLSVYIGDARALEMDLVSMGQDSVHDWNYLLGRLHMLAYDTRLDSTVHGLGTLLWLISLLFGGWICLVMARQKSSPA